MKRVILSVLVVGLLAAACGNDEGTGTAGPAGPEGRGGVEAQESTEDRLPEGFPPEMPLPEDHTVVFSTWTEDTHFVLFTSGHSYEELRGSMISGLAETGWRMLSCSDTEVAGEQVTVMIASNQELLATVGVGYTALPNMRYEGRYDFYVAVLRSGQPAAGEQEPATCP